MADSPSIDGSDYVYLTDISAKDKPWDIHKQESRIVSKIYDGAGLEKYSKRIWECSQSLQFALTANAEGTMKLRLHSARFCRARWCPVCLWRKSLMWRARFIKALPAILADYPRGRFVFLTLTVKNCQLTELRETLAVMGRAWIRLTQRKNFPAIGWLKSVEVTRGVGGTAHPHLHCLLMVKPSYFTHGYLSQATWSQLWRDCLRADYTPIVNIKTVKNRKSSSQIVNGSVDFDDNNNGNPPVDNDVMAGLLETIKYSVKPSDLVDDSEEGSNWLIELTKQMHKIRSIALGGVFKKYLSEDDPEDLIHADLDDETELSDEDVMLVFDWAEIVRRYARKDI